MAREVTKVLPAAEMALKTMAYNQEERNFAPGDRIVALRNDKGLSLQNGLLGEIKTVDEKGVALVDFSGKEIQVDLNRYNHLDHAYAVTLHKSQGATVEQAIMFSYLKPGDEWIEAHRNGQEPPQESYGRASYNALNVAVTRAQYGTIVMTNTLSGLAHAVEKVDVKTSTLNPIAGNRAGPAHPLPSLAAPAPRKGHTLTENFLAAQLDSLERTVRSPTIEKEQPLPHPGRAVPPLGKNPVPRAVAPPVKAMEIDLEK